MSGADETIAIASALTALNDMLTMERAILDIMVPRDPETRTVVMAQAGRVSAMTALRDSFVARFQKDASHAE